MPQRSSSRLASDEAAGARQLAPEQVRMLNHGSCCCCRSKQGGSPGAYDRSFRWKYHQFRFLCHVSRAALGPWQLGGC